MADALEDVPDPVDDPMEVAEATEVSVVLTMVPVEADLVTSVAVGDVLVITETTVADSVVGVSETVDETLLDEEAIEMVDEAAAEEERALEAEVLTVAAEMLELELELPSPDATILNGKEYWKVLGSESKVIFRPYVASSPRSLPTVQE